MCSASFHPDGIMAGGLLIGTWLCLDLKFFLLLGLEPSHTRTVTCHLCLQKNYVCH